MANDKPQGSFARLMAGGKPKKEPVQKAVEAPAPAQKPVRTTENNTVSHIACDITILQSDINELHAPAYMVGTFRLREENIEWVKDTAYALSKEVKPRKVSQADIVRISFKIVEKLLEKNREEIIELLKQIK